MFQTMLTVLEVFGHVDFVGSVRYIFIVDDKHNDFSHFVFDWSDKYTAPELAPC